MKKLIGIILLMLAVIFIGYYFVNAEEIVNVKSMEKIEGTVYNKTRYEVAEMLNYWMEMYRSNVKIDSMDETGYVTVTGVIVTNEFEEEQGVACTLENIEKIIKEHYILSYFNISKVGTYELYDVYKMEAKSEDEPIGYLYDETGKEVNYHEGCIYFMVLCNEEE